MTQRRGEIGLAVLLVVITAAVFSPVLRHHFIEAWDDSPAILKNPDYNPPRLQNLVHYWVPPLRKAFYVPVTYSLWGFIAMVSRSSAPPDLPFNPAFFYLANLIAHAVASGLVFLIITRLVPKRLPAWLGAALFALHPVQVEGVATASSVYTPLSGAFSFFAIWQYLIFSEKSESETDARRGAWWHYMLATAGFVLALLTKPTVVSLPLVIAAIEFLLRRRRLITLALPLGAWVALALIVVRINQSIATRVTAFVPEPLLRPIVPFDAIAFYLGKLVLPVHLVSDYGRTPGWLVHHPWVWISCLVPVAVFGILWRFRSETPWLLTAYAIFVAALLPSIGIIPFNFQHYSTVADRYLYIAMLGPAIAATFFLSYFGSRLVIVSTVGVLALLACLSINQLSHWQDDWTLMNYTYEVNPHSLSASTGLMYLLTPWQHDKPPDGPFPAARLCTLDQTTLIGLADRLRENGAWTLAEPAYQKAIARGTKSAAIYNHLGDCFANEDDASAASQAYQEALRLDPTNIDARTRLDALRDHVTPQ